MSKILAGIARGVIFAMWTPDFVCGLAARELIEKGGVHGYPHYDQAGWLLRLVEEGIVDDDWLVWQTGEELRSLFDSHDRSELI
ncbi:hypothetical protein AAE026_31285 [Bradyrhizobium sp. DN5]|uniref:hypothetical protein n=1 Tax=Bradyrhizobium sp. DN5 TaxID=3056950 RepID=UPI003524C120